MKLTKTAHPETFSPGVMVSIDDVEIGIISWSLITNSNDGYSALKDWCKEHKISFTELKQTKLLD